ncbi:hypothetical protein A2U01_0061147, partial [Trifolium medium]|nr:hypothetical protein [Trifolium medium]
MRLVVLDSRCGDVCGFDGELARERGSLTARERRSGGCVEIVRREDGGARPETWRQRLVPIRGGGCDLLLLSFSFELSCFFFALFVL